MATVILKLPAVKARTALGRTQIYELIRRGEFPKQIQLGTSRSVGWLECEVEDWITARVAESRGGAQ